MWTCPKCKQRFVNKNQWHSCGSFSEQDFLNGKSEASKKLYEGFKSVYRSLCDFQIHPVKSRIAFMVEMRFASINYLGKEHLLGHLVFHTPYEDTTCFHRVEQIDKNQYVHHFRLSSLQDITDELKMYMHKACMESGHRQ